MWPKRKKLSEIIVIHNNLWLDLSIVIFRIIFGYRNEQKSTPWSQKAKSKIDLRKQETKEEERDTNKRNVSSKNGQ